MDNFPTANQLRSMSFGDELQNTEQKCRQEKLNALLEECRGKIVEARQNQCFSFFIPTQGHSKQALLDMVVFLKTKGYNVRYEDTMVLVRWDENV
jgi:hypothetical protein